MKKKITRRTFLQIVAVAGAAGGCWQLGLFTGDARLQVARRSQPIMGTYLNLTVYGKDRDACEAAIDRTISRMKGLEAILSRHMPTSQVATLNSTGRLDSPDKDLLELLGLSAGLSERSDGAFDVTILPVMNAHSEFAGKYADSSGAITQARTATGYRYLAANASSVQFQKTGMGITLDGIGKGYIVDQGVAALKAAGFHNVCVDAGGDLMVAGAKPDGSPWRIGIRNPRIEQPMEPVSVKVINRAVATSGDYFQPYTADFRNHHILDPRTGFSSPDLASCTITAPTVGLADGLATAVMALGRDTGLELLESLDGCEGYLIDKQQRNSHSSGFFS
ncbi:FAD:protein FMN transferase [Desulfosediminicola ganghwensis]|uniref:FAD:protein FMN transferase n=1 Tax=Desulfosediminicola ganghwensis TaxID=2569540 RepID=UPI0010AD8035|nr:FAD:protein FMN transferase [Desulfosediminicola ganghwensis]